MYKNKENGNDRRTKTEKMMSNMKRDEREQRKDSENMRKNESKTVATVDTSDPTHLRVLLDFSDTL